ncbi:FtsQ-type POTRA domain-containing protein [bacterium]|nr:FtsQ-type POTRA domain-containing protein [bacterium]
MLFVSHLFEIKNIQISGVSTYVNRPDIESVAAGIARSKNIFLLKKSDLRDQLHKSFLAAQDISCQKKLPDTLIVTVTERRPVARVKGANSEDYFLMDGEGYVLGIADETFIEFPVVHYGEDVMAGTFLNAEIIPLSHQIINGAIEHELQISSMSFTLREVQVHLEGGTTVFINTQKEVHDCMDAISSLLKNADLEGKAISKIDLRYDKVVVSYE